MMRTWINRSLWTTLATLEIMSIGLLVSGCNNNGNNANATKLNAGGATFIYPMMAKWASEYNKAKGVEVAYASTGSGAGKAQMIEMTIDFGCSDAPLNEEEIKKANASKGEVIHVPLAMGAVVPAYNLDEVKDKPIRFTGDVLADIYLGKIKKWNDTRIQASQEPGVVMPDKEIVVVHRSDGSGTTYIWVDYLAKQSEEWKKGPGVGSTIKWPAGVGQQGNEGVTAHVKQTPGAIGYVELIYALQNKVKYGSVKNKEGHFVEADMKAVTAAAAGALTSIPDDLRYSLTDAPGKDAYPISGTNWAILYVDPPSGKGKAIYDYLWWVTHDGQSLCEALHYARLPQDLISRVEKQMEKIKK
ncbi:MAG TPA: phosphate ABC transporter substrate-binding protein PstS [Gemmataceae bacterium]|nr:phosphate ABC transporter substrate-binding protein PstS [Gemmataceae bacterium]